MRRRALAMVMALAALAGCGALIGLPSSLGVEATDGGAGDAGDAGADAAPVLLAGGLTAPFSVGTDGTTVYWSDSEDQNVYRVAVSGGVSTMIPGSPVGQSPPLIAVDDSGVYWAADFCVWKSPPGGGSVAVWQPMYCANGMGLDTPQGIATDGRFVYVADHATSGNILRLSEQADDDGGTRFAFNACAPLWDSGLPTFGGLAVGGGNVFWTADAPPGSGSPAGVVSTSPADSGPGGGCSPVAASQDNPGAIVTDGTYLYWLTQGTPPGPGALHMVDVANSVMVVDVTTVDAPGGLAMDANAVYWTSGGTPGAAYADGSVWRMTRGANGMGAIVRVAMNRGRPGAITLTPTEVIWAERGAAAADGGLVAAAGGLWKMAR